METLVNAAALSNFYFQKKVFITGHTGFKGAWLTACLHSWGAVVKGYALEPEYADNLYDVLNTAQYCESVIGDIRDRERLDKELIRFQPDIIFHLAAQPLVRRSYQVPAETFDINVTGTANLLEAVRRLEQRCAVVIITTDKVYENKEQDILYSESDTLGGYDPYSASKAAAEIVISSFRNSFFNISSYPVHLKAVASARAGNVIGGGDWSTDRLIPDIIQSLKRQQPVVVRNPASVRPWQHVLEPLTGYCALGAALYLDAPLYSGAYNFGPANNDHLTVQELVETAIKCWGGGNWTKAVETPQPHEAQLLKLSIQKAEAVLNWHPKLHSQQAIEWTVNWYKQPAANLRHFTFEQIHQYYLL